MPDYKIIADMHCHTVRSKNSYSTLLENISVAKQKGLLGIAVTDYGPKGEYYQLVDNLITMSRYIPKEIDGIKIYSGIEANVLNIMSGEIDVKEKESDLLDWIIASYHKISEFDSSIINTQSVNRMYKELILNPVCMTIGHMERVNIPFDVKGLVSLAKKNAKVIELNNLSVRESEANYVQMKEILLACIAENAPICVVSNAHIATDIGNFDTAIKLLKEIDFPPHLIINSDIDLLNDYIKKFRQMRSVKIENLKKPRQLLERAK